MTQERPRQAKNQRASAEAVQLRRRAEERLKVEATTTPARRKESDPQRLLHELRVRQIELERQNEELRQAKQEGEDAYHSLFENSLEAILLTVPDGRILAANPAACRMFGHTEEDMRRLGRDGVVDPADPRLATALAERAQSGKARAELTFVRSDGSRFTGEASSGVFKDRNGLLRTSMVIRDITERKRAEEKLRESEERFRAVADYTADWENWIGPDGELLWVNPAVEQITGYSVAEFFALHTPSLPLCAEEDRALVCAQFQRAMRGSRESDQEFRFVRKDGTKRWGSVSWQPIYSSDGTPLGHRSSIRDITDRKRMEDQLLEEQQRLRSLASELSLAEQRERRRVAALLHDDVIQSLALCQIKLGGLQQRVPTPDLAASVEAIREVLEGVIKQARTLTLELSPAILHELGLEAALDWLVEQFTTEHGLECRFESDGQLEPLDEDMSAFLFSATRELLLNVVKHAQADHASIRAQREGESIRIAVEDDGVGFDTSRIRARFGKTSGYGLFNLHERLAYLGGLLELRSEPGRGTCVGLVVLVKPTGSV